MPVVLSYEKTFVDNLAYNDSNFKLICDTKYVELMSQYIYFFSLVRSMFHFTPACK